MGCGSFVDPRTCSNAVLQDNTIPTDIQRSTSRKKMRNRRGRGG